MDKSELDKFMDNFWKDKEAGIDYKGFLRIFEKYQLRMDREKQASSGPKVISEESVRIKKQIFSDLNQALKQHDKTLNQLFRKIDSDNSTSISINEFSQLFSEMKVNVAQKKL
jgi:Ca2+-binding EF-hand superfamily protein